MLRLATRLPECQPDTDRLPSLENMKPHAKVVLNSARNSAMMLILAALPPHALAGGPQKSSAGQTPAAMYQSYCSVCHGDAGDGRSRARASLNPPPVDFTQPAARESLTRERMILGVREGRPGTAMVGWKTQLSDAQIAMIVDFVREKFMHAGPGVTAAGAKAQAPIKPSAPTVTAAGGAAAADTTLNGNVSSGQRLYQQNCIACHGAAGDGNGPRAYFIIPKPRSFLTAESRTAFTRPILRISIAQGKRGTEMPSWEKVLNAQEIADIAEYVFQQFIADAGKAGLQTRK